MTDVVYCPYCEKEQILDVEFGIENMYDIEDWDVFIAQCCNCKKKYSVKIGYVLCFKKVSKVHSDNIGWCELYIEPSNISTFNL